MQPNLNQLRRLIQQAGGPSRVARDVGMTYQNLWRILSAKQDPPASTLAAILDAVGGSWSDLDPDPSGEDPHGGG